MTFGIFFKVWINSIFNFTVVILILPYLSIVVRWNTPVNSLIVTKGRVPEMDILLVINPFSPCTEFYTICSHKRYLLGVLSDNRRSNVLSEIFKVIKWFWWSRWWRDCNIYILLWSPCARWYSGQDRGSHDIFAQNKIPNERKWTCFIISKDLILRL